MYNEDQKNGYMQWKKDTNVIQPKTLLSSIFHKVEAIETQLNKDACNFTKKEILDFYSIANYWSMNTLANVNCVLSDYTNWCIRNGLSIDNQNHYKEIHRKEYTNYVNKAIHDVNKIDREQLLEAIKNLSNPTDQFIILGIFEGLGSTGYRDFIDIHGSDVEGNILHCPYTHRDFKMSSELTHLALDAATEKMYYPINGGTPKKAFEQDDSIIKSSPNVSNSDLSKFRRKIYKRIILNLETMNMPFLKTPLLINSGKVSFIKNKCAELHITPDDFIQDDNLVHELEVQYNCKFVPSLFIWQNKELFKTMAE